MKKPASNFAKRIEREAKIFSASVALLSKSPIFSKNPKETTSKKTDKGSGDSHYFPRKLHQKKYIIKAQVFQVFRHIRAIFIL